MNNSGRFWLEAHGTGEHFLDRKPTYCAAYGSVRGSPVFCFIRVHLRSSVARKFFALDYPAKPIVLFVSFRFNRIGYSRCTK